MQRNLSCPQYCFYESIIRDSFFFFFQNAITCQSLLYLIFILPPSTQFSLQKRNP
jgi:hypothetical protein